jgi:hypothetical protein
MPGFAWALIGATVRVTDRLHSIPRMSSTICLAYHVEE